DNIFQVIEDRGLDHVEPALVRAPGDPFFQLQRLCFPDYLKVFVAVGAGCLLAEQVEVALAQDLVFAPPEKS
ncbi:MAG: hypothetical protein COZ29_00245, partial [Candidatus Moranbacteria bacterium CG_4_10_14_3_um_filter_45_9]